MTPTSNSDDLVHKICYLIRDLLKDRSRSLSEPVKKITQEREFVNILQSVTDYGNTNFLKSFGIRLAMDCYDDSDDSIRMEEPRT